MSPSFHKDFFSSFADLVRLGIGGRKDTDQARKWYDKVCLLITSWESLFQRLSRHDADGVQASRLGNREAGERLRALAQPNPLFLSVQEHESHLNNTLVRRRTQAAMRSDQRPDRQHRRRGRDEGDTDRNRERMMAEADRAAGAHRAEFGAMSPNPDMLSPRIGPGSSHTSSAVTYPSRPSSGYQPFALNRLPSPNPSQGHVPPVQARRSSGVVEAKRYSLSDNPGDRVVSMGSEGGRQGQSPVKKGPQTFAEMGFQSKPVADEGCLIM